MELPEFEPHDIVNSYIWRTVRTWNRSFELYNVCNRTVHIWSIIPIPNNMNYYRWQPWNEEWGKKQANKRLTLSNAISYNPLPMLHSYKKKNTTSQMIYSYAWICRWILIVVEEYICSTILLHLKMFDFFLLQPNACWIYTKFPSIHCQTTVL